MGAPVVTIGVIGGSGLYEVDGLQDVREVRVDTPFGAPSDALIVADGTSCRHQIKDGSGRGALHVARVLAISLDNGAAKAPALS